MDPVQIQFPKSNAQTQSSRTYLQPNFISGYLSTAAERLTLQYRKPTDRQPYVLDQMDCLLYGDGGDDDDAADDDDGGSGTY